MKTFARSFAAALLACGLSAVPALAQDDADLVDPIASGELTPEEQVKAVLEQGQKQFQEGDFDAAVGSFTTIVNAYERAGAFAPGPLVLRAKAYAQLEEYEAALEDLKKATQYSQSQPQILPEIQSTRGEVYMKVDAYDAALPDLQAAVQANRMNPQYQFDYGKAMVKLGGAEQGEKALTKYLDILASMEEVPEGEDAQKAEALRLRGQAYGAMRKFEEAEADLAASLEIEPDNYEPYFTRAQIALVNENYADATANLEQAIAKYVPKDEEDTLPFVQGYLTLASAYEEQGKALGREGDDEAAAQQYALSAATCEKLLDLLPEKDQRVGGVKVAALYRLGVAERLQGELAKAVKSFSKLLQLDPNQGEAYFRRGICFHFLGEERLAIRDFEQAASINFDSPRSNLWKGMSWAKLGDMNEAIRAYGESIAVSDRYVPAFVNRGLAHLAQGDYRKAIDDLNEAIRLQPTESLHYYRRGRAQAAAGDREKAIQSYMNAIEFNEKLAPAYEQLTTELEASGETVLANQYRSKAAELGL
ncbi:tetratricopeptide repeat protein [Botrimarina mediterranea]|uniref:Photosystem I assembly protein Ycf3 n=1 Tax=Botrimarina mediterranea TaxID=2528022 RepID=A0A518K2M8_9BACT|nr:tetratricopeptide repeat protein [Botrimarina mediterranea]QDV72051.1 photosystem I assembly protein Ycf3 [Botrimarina mediterranea]QDV76592.1 photosystem I assembly protein Ycf3 [Planctomycetes bacterium K2D]